MTSSTSTGGALNNAAKVATSENNVVIKVEPLTQLTIQSPAQGQIEIQAGEDIASIQSLKFVRNGDNLEIFTADGTRAAVIIEGYYAQETPPDIYGIDDQGDRYTWSSIGATSMVAALTDGESSVQEATPAMEVTAEAPEEKQEDDDKAAAGLFGLSPGWAAAAAGLAAAAIAGGVIAATGGGKDDDNGNGSNGNGNGGNGGNGTTGPTGTLSNIQFINDNDPANPVIITNGVTNDSTPKITGKVEGAKEGDRVAIKDGDTVLGYAIVDKDGNWTFTPNKDLGEGSHQITAELQDADGNAGHSQQVDLTIDITGPGTAGNITVDGKPADDENITGNNTPTLGGDAEPGSTITITDGEGNVIGSAVADEDGHWEIIPNKPLGDGDQDLIIDVTDPAGNNNSSELPINVDTIPPTGTLSDIQFINDNDPANPTAITNGSTNDSTPLITGKVEGAEKGDRVAIKDGDTLLGYAEIDENGNWSYTPQKPLGEGQHQITAELQDAAGNTGDSQNVGLNIDTTPPEAPGNITVDGKPNDGENITDGNTPTIGGDGEPGNTIIITDGNGNVIGSTVVDDDGHWELTPDQPLNGGNGNLVITEKDPAGNSSPSTDLPVNIGGGSAGGDTDAPTATLSDIVMTNDNDPANPVVIQNGGLTNDNTPTISGKVEGLEAGDRIVIRKGEAILGEATVDENGNWTFTPTEPLDEELNELTIEVQDAAGNAGTPHQVSVNIDTQPPAAATDITIDGNPANDTGNDLASGQPVIGGKGEPGSTIIITDGNGNEVGTAVVDDEGNWTLTPDQPLADGDGSLNITVKDPAGNSSPSTNLPVNVGGGENPGGDTDAPTATLSDIVMTNDNDPANPVVIQNGGLTNDNTPTISGKVEGLEAGDRIVIRKGEAILGEATVDENGNWTFTPTEPLDEELNELTIEVQDAAGNAGTPHQVSVNIDTQPPAAATDITIDGNPANDTGNDLASGQPVIGGKGEPGSTIIITDGNGNEVGTAVVDDEGNWTLTPDQPLADGDGSLNITVKDPAGNSSPSTNLPVNVGGGENPGGDTDAPTATLSDIVMTNDNDPANPVVIQNGGLTNDNTPTISGKVEGLEAGDRIVIRKGEAILGEATVDENGNWTFTLTEPLDEELNELTIEVQDAAGNAGTPHQVSVNIDTQPPAAATDITIDGNPANDTGNDLASGQPVIGGKGEPGSTIIITDGNGNEVGTAVVDDEGNWTLTPDQPLADGDGSLNITVKDPAGNSSPSTNLPVNVGGGENPGGDTDAPTATLSDIVMTNDNDPANPVVIQNGGLTNDNTPTISGKVEGLEAGDRIVIRKGEAILGEATVDENGNWTFTPTEPLDEELNELTIEVQDAAGNAGTPHQVSVNIDTTPPAGTTTIAATDDAGNVIDGEHPTNDSTPTFSGQVTNAQAGDYVVIKDGDRVLGTATINADGTWEFTVPEGEELEENGHSITATITDAAGNVGNITDPVEYDQDNTNPDPATNVKVTNDQTSTDVATGGLTNDNTPTISGKAEAGCTVYIYDKNGLAIASVVADADGNWRVQTSMLIDGDYNDMTVQVVDNAGNMSTSTPVPDFTVDTLNTNKTTITTDAEQADPTPTFKGQVAKGEEDADYSQMTITIYDRNGVVIATNIPVKTDGSWEYTVPEADALGSGPHNISAVVVDAANNEGDVGYLNGTADGSWTIPATLYSDAGGGEGDMFGYAMMVSGEYIYISAPNGGTNAAGQPTNQGIIYAVKKEFASLLDGGTSIEKLFAANPGMGTIISNNGDAKGDGQPDVNSYQGYGMKVLDGGWVAIYMHLLDTVYFVQESTLTDNNFDLSQISDAANGKSQYGFMMTLANGIDSWFGFNANSIVNEDGTLTFLIGDIHGAREQTGSITTVTFNPNGTNPDGNWTNMHLIRDPNDSTDNAPWVPQETLPDGMVIGHIGHENTNGTVGSTQSYNFGTDIVYMGDVFGNGSNYVAFMDAASAHTGKSYRGSWYFYKIPDTGLPNDFSIGDVADEDLIVIDNIGAGYLNLITNDVIGDFGSDEYKPNSHNIAMLGHFGSGEHTDIAIASAGDSYGGSNGKVWILHTDKITDDMTIGVNVVDSKFNTDVGYAIVSKVQAGRGDKGEGFGLNVIGGYDMNGDGTQDLIISDPLAMKDGKCVGAVYIVYGGHQADYMQYLASLGENATGEIDIQYILDKGWGEVHYGNVDAQRFGWSVEVVDMNNDNMPDLLVGAPSQLGTPVPDADTGAATNPQYNGQVHVIYNTHTAPAEDPAPNARSYNADEQNQYDDGGIPLLLDGDHQNVDLAALTDSLKDTHSIDLTDGNNTLQVNNQTLDSWEGADGDALIVSGENGLVQLTGGIENWHSNGTVTVDGKVYTEYQSSGMAEVLIEDRIHVNIL